MVYNPPHPCACYLEAKLYGYNALAPARESMRQRVESGASDRLERGPAYHAAVVTEEAPSDREWPTYRKDAARSGATAASVPVTLQQAWSTPVGGRLSALTIAGGRVYVASVDTHTVHALDADTGRTAWTYTTGGRVDSPPTLWNGRVLFGSADGYVYCLRAEDGDLMWRFRAAPADLRHAAMEQLESVWPVPSSVLICDAEFTESGRDELWCVAGRSMFVDGGLRLLRMDPADGRLIDEVVMDERVPESDENLQVRLKSLNMPVALNDILSCDGDFVYMRSQRFDAAGVRHEIEVPTLDVGAQGEGAHLFSPTGFLDDIWWHRSYWVYGRVWKSGAGGYYQAGRVNPAGRPLVFNADTVFGFGRKPEYYRWTTPLEYQLFASAKRPETARPGGEPRTARKKPAGKQGEVSPAKKRTAGLSAKPSGQIVTEWTLEIPVLARAMVLADETLFVAGPPDLIDENETLKTFSAPATQEQLAQQAAALDGAAGAALWAVSTTGEKLAQIPLDGIPAWDSLVAIEGRLYLSTTDGSVICLGD
jgi:hypothetical protein